MSSLMHVGDQKYECATIIRAFKYFATPRRLYNRLREDYELPSVKALTRLTFKVKKTDDTQLLKNVFENIKGR